MRAGQRRRADREHDTIHVVLMSLPHPLRFVGVGDDHYNVVLTYQHNPWMPINPVVTPPIASPR